MAAACHSSLLLALLAMSLLAGEVAGQTFSYSRGWKSGKRAGTGFQAVPASGRARDDVLAEELPLFRYFLEGRGEHRAPFDPWRSIDEPERHPGGRPSLVLGQAGDQNNEHDDR